MEEIRKKKKNYYNHNNQYNRNNYYNRKKRKEKKVLLDDEMLDENVLLQKEDSIIKEEPVKNDINDNIEIQEDVEYIPIKKKENIFKSKLSSLKNIFSFKKQNMLKFAGVFILLIAIVGTSYSFFSYYKEDSRQADIIAGEIYVKLVENEANLTLNRMYPRTLEEARSRNDNYIDFTIKGKNTSTNKVAYYEINLNDGEDVNGKVRIDPKYILFDLQEKVNGDYEYIKEAISYTSFNFKDFIPENTTSEMTKEYRLRMWISDEIVISDTEENASYTQAEFANLYANIKVSVNAYDGNPPKPAHETVQEAITAKINAETNSCNPIWVDDMGTANDESDDITYFSGTNDCVDMNYVWYSGKLWRITAIYPDGAMKLVTEDMLTSIYWGSSIEYDGSWVYQWLNEDFYDTLVNPNDIIISNATWNYSTDGNSTPVSPESIATQKIKESPIGLLNAYEYYNAYRNANKTTNYLNIGYSWWLITPYSTSYVRNVEYGNPGYYSPAASVVYGVRPSINLKSALEFSGNGTKSEPYKIVGDKESPSSGVLISSRSVGEYVKFDGDNYRIVSIDETNGTTKLTRVDYLRNNGTVITKNFASTVYFGKSTNTQTDTYWDYYLNNTWYNNISSTYKDMLVDGTYYLGLYAVSGKHYKITTCKDATSTLDSITTKNCTKYTESDIDKTFTGKVGLPRVGEMFSSQLGSGYSTASYIWTITPYSTSLVRHVSIDCNLSYSLPASDAYGVRPSIYLKSGIKITGGTGYVGGETNSPFEISE